MSDQWLIESPGLGLASYSPSLFSTPCDRPACITSLLVLPSSLYPLFLIISESRSWQHKEKRFRINQPAPWLSFLPTHALFYLSCSPLREGKMRTQKIYIYISRARTELGYYNMSLAVPLIFSEHHIW